MGSIGHGVGVSVGARIGAAIKNSVEALGTIEVEHIVERALEHGIFDYDHGPRTCSRGHVLTDADRFCPTCGEGSREDQTKPEQSEDNEIERAEDQSVHSLEDDDLPEIPVERELPAYFKDALIECEFASDEAEHIAYLIASRWEEEELTQDKYSAWIQELTDLDTKLKARLAAEEVVKRLCEEARKYRTDHRGSAGTPPGDPPNGRSPMPPAGQTEFRTELRIFADGKVEVHDPLQNIVLKRHRRLRLGPIELSAKATFQFIKGRKERFFSLGKALYDARRPFFTASSGDPALHELARSGMTQKEVAGDASIPEPTLSRWCSSEKGIWIGTPHGNFPLSAFFGRNAKVVQGSPLRRAIILGHIVDAMQELGPSVEPSDIWSFIEDEEGLAFDMSGRAERDYRRHARNMKKIIDAQNDLPEAGRGPTQISEALGGEIRPDDVRSYLKLIRIYEDYKQGIEQSSESDGLDEAA